MTILFVFAELRNDVHVAVEKRDKFLKDFSSKLSEMLSAMDKMQKGSLIESIHNSLKVLDVGSSIPEVGIEKRIKDLEDRERKLVVAFNKVMANLYLLPGYVLAVSSGVSGLLSSDPHICGLLICVILVVLSFLAALGLAVRFALKQLGPLLPKQITLALERKQLYSDFKNETRSCTGVQVETVETDSARVSAGGVWTSYEEVNQELEFQAYYYWKFLWLIILCGLLYALMLSVAGYCVLCDCKVGVELYLF